MPLIPDSVIDDIHARVDIVELIGRYVPLKRAGRHFKAHCPFHKERGPSFMVNGEKQIFHCFGCGVGGNAFSFLMQHDRLTFPEAVRQLAEHVGIEVSGHASPSDDGERQRLLTLLETAGRYFERTLRDPKLGAQARAYLVSRGVAEATREAFRIGVAPSGWDRLLKAAQETGVSAGLLEVVGLAARGPRGVYDRFRSRLMFPIVNLRGQVVGFGGRSLDGKEPKYLNSPETALYIKGRHLFGLFQAKDAIVKAKTAIVVEGYFDCVVLAGGGIANVVSPLGTALTAEQAKLLKRYAERIVLAFDADAAGEQATLRGIDLLVEAGLEVAVAPLPMGVDPDEYLRAHGRKRFEQLLQESPGLFEVLVSIALTRYLTTSAEGKVQAAQFILPTLAKVPDAMLRREYVRLLAERLQLDEEAVGKELAKVPPRPATESGYSTGGGVADGSAKAAGRGGRGPERMLAALILDDPSRWSQAQGLTLEDVTDPSLRRILSVACELEAADRSASASRVISRVAAEGYGELVTELVELAQSLASPEEAWADCVTRLPTQARKRRQAALQEQLRLAHAAGREDDVRRLLMEVQRISAPEPRRMVHGGHTTQAHQ